MTDMTQPERPERADIPGSEVQSSSEGVEPTHIGVVRHREARESFNPLAPQTPDTGPTAPTGPADRSSIESLRREAERLASRSQPAEAPSIPLGEPVGPRQDEGMPLMAKVGAVAGALAVAAGGFLGFNKIRSGDDGGERPGVIITDPTLKPTEPAPTFTPEATQITEATSTINPETTPTPIITQEIEKSPHEERVREAAKKYFKEIGEPINNFGDKLFITSSIDLQNRVAEPPNSQGFVENQPVLEIYADLEEFPDGIEKIEKAANIGMYLAWNEMQENKKDSQMNLVLDEIPDLSKLQGVVREEAEREVIDKASEFTRRVNAGEDFSFIVRGYEDTPSDFTTEIQVNPIEPVVVVLLSDKEGSFIGETAKRGVSFTEIDGILFIGLHGATAGAGYKDVSDQNQWHFRSEASGDLSIGYSLLGMKSVHKQLERQDVLTSISQTQLQQRVNLINKQLVSNFLDRNNYLSWSGPLRAR